MSSPQTAIYLQDACLSHRYIRNAETHNVVERPERLRAVKAGLAAALARLEELVDATSTLDRGRAPSVDLTTALEQLRLGSTSPAPEPAVSPISACANVVRSEAKVDLLNHAAVKFVHGDIDGDVYLEKLILWAKGSEQRITESGSEIPEKMSQGDLYLCPGSVDAIQGALGTVCEAVDAVMTTPVSRAFVAIRPPGHHCGEDTPSGFCFVNNVVVAAAHAHLAHKAKRAVIFDIDLHHGNGTQALAWQINEESYRQALEDAANPLAVGGGQLQVFYGSIHDILSYPCEDGKPALVQAASTNIHGPHGQYITNIHLEPYNSEEHFRDELYAKKYSRIFDRAEEFLAATGSSTDDVIVFISCGFDACEHEYESMSRHGRKVPTSFYHRFATDARRFADRLARGRLLSVLEGGYSDRALTSGAFAHLAGLAATPDGRVQEDWWAATNLDKLDKATKKRRGARKSAGGGGGGGNEADAWVARALEILGALEPAGASPAARRVVLPSTRVLRERSPLPAAGGSPGKARKPVPAGSRVGDAPPMGQGAQAKRLPRVVLKVGPPPAS